MAIGHGALGRISVFWKESLPCVRILTRRLIFSAMFFGDLEPSLLWKLSKLALMLAGSLALSLGLCSSVLLGCGRIDYERIPLADGGVAQLPDAGEVAPIGDANTSPCRTEGLLPGLKADYFVGDIDSVTQFDWSSTPVSSGIVAQIDQSTLTGMPDYSDASLWPGGPIDDFIARYQGWICLETAGRWFFTLRSDDGSTLAINSLLIVDHDGNHAASGKSGVGDFEAGLFSFELRFFESTGGFFLQLEWLKPDTSASAIVPAAALFHSP